MCIIIKIKKLLVCSYEFLQVVRIEKIFYLVRRHHCTDRNRNDDNKQEVETNFFMDRELSKDV
jgi:hypothetical protein